MDTTDALTVTVAIPTYNEALYIRDVIFGFLNEQYPELVEIFIADGGSTDGTQDIVKQISQQNSQVKLLHNFHKVQSFALNLMLQEAKGNIFLRADAHCDYAPDYIEKCVKALISSQALNVGGAQRFVAKTAFQSGVALSARSVLGNGGAKYRDSNYAGFADTVFMGCFWRKALLDISGYDTEMRTNEDAELNQRLLQKSSKAIYISPSIKVWYFPRKTAKSLWTQYFKYGRGRVLTSSKHPKKSPFRTRLPLLICILSVFTIVFVSFYLDLVYGLVPILIIFAIFLLESVRVSLKYRAEFDKEIWRGGVEEKPNLMMRIFYCWLTLIIMPIAYVIGNVYQYSKNKILRKSGW